VAAAAVACIVVGLAVSLSQSSQTTFASISVSRDASGRTIMRVSGLPAAPDGKTYEAWVIRPGRPPRPAALFPGGVSMTSRLPGTVPQNSIVAVTVERAGGVHKPTTTPILSTPT
jgi:anti-sigma-K factor RskA